MVVFADFERADIQARLELRRKTTVIRMIRIGLYDLRQAAVCEAGFGWGLPYGE